MDNEEILLNFMEVSNLPIEEARIKLQEAGGNLQLAIQQHYDSQQETEDLPSNLIHEDADEVRPVIPRAYDILIPENRRVNQLCRVGNQFISNFRDLKREMEIQEEIARGHVPKKKCLEDIFRNPVDITSNFEFNYAKSFGTSVGKWLAVLINNESFESLSFNRDIFNEPSLRVKKILKENFVFLRKNSNDEEGINIMRIYNIMDHPVPIFLLIDSLTGELKKNFGDCNKLKVKSVIKELKKYTSSKDKQLIYNSSYEDSDENDDTISFEPTRSLLVTSKPSTSSSQTHSKPIETTKANKYDTDEESFASISSSDSIEDDNEHVDENEEAKVLDSDDELLKKDDGPETHILLKLLDENHKFKYPAKRTVGQLINYIYMNYLLPTGIYDNKTKRFSLFSKIHNKCLTLLDNEKSLEESKIHPSIVLLHNTIDKD